MIPSTDSNVMLLTHVLCSIITKLYFFSNTMSQRDYCLATSLYSSIDLLEYYYSNSCCVQILYCNSMLDSKD